MLYSAPFTFKLESREEILYTCFGRLLRSGSKISFCCRHPVRNPTLRARVFPMKISASKVSTIAGRSMEVFAQKFQKKYEEREVADAEAGGVGA